MARAILKSNGVPYLLPKPDPHFFAYSFAYGHCSHPARLGATDFLAFLTQTPLDQILWHLSSLTRAGLSNDYQDSVVENCLPKFIFQLKNGQRIPLLLHGVWSSKLSRSLIGRHSLGVNLRDRRCIFVHISDNLYHVLWGRSWSHQVTFHGFEIVPTLIITHEIFFHLSSTGWVRLF